MASHHLMVVSTGVIIINRDMIADSNKIGVFGVCHWRKSGRNTKHQQTQSTDVDR
jgi:hypothetical protein